MTTIPSRPAALRASARPRLAEPSPVLDERVVAATPTFTARPNTLSGLDAYEAAVRQRFPLGQDRVALLADGRSAYFQALRKIGGNYANALLHQLSLVV